MLLCWKLCSQVLPSHGEEHCPRTGSAREVRANGGELFKTPGLTLVAVLHLFWHQGYAESHCWALQASRDRKAP